MIYTINNASAILAEALFLLEYIVVCENLFDIIDSINDEYIKFWVDVSNAESPTDFKQGVDIACGYFIDVAKKMGWQIEVLENDFSGNAVCITMNSQSKEKPICVSGHLDTVHSVGSFGTPAVKIEDNKIYGPGVMDCKGGTVAALEAMVALQKAGFDKRPVKLLLQTDEEVNSMLSNKATINFICEKAKDAVAFLNCESIKNNTAVLWRKGISRYRIEVKGKAIHASRCAEGGASAILEAANKIIELEKFKDNKGLTSNCGLINGGTKANTVSDKCTFVVEYRFVNNEQFELAEKVTYEIANKSTVVGTSATVERIGLRPAMEKCDRNFELLEKINKIYKEVGLPELSARGSLGGSDAADTTSKGIPTIDSIGVSGDFIHTPDEFAYVSSLKEAAKRIASVIYCF